MRFCISNSSQVMLVKALLWIQRCVGCRVPFAPAFVHVVPGFQYSLLLSHLNTLFRSLLRDFSFDLLSKITSTPLWISWNPMSLLLSIWHSWVLCFLWTSFDQIFISPTRVPALRWRIHLFLLSLHLQSPTQCVALRTDAHYIVVEWIRNGTQVALSLSLH